MRIAFFADNFLPQINGVVTATLNLIKGLADKGHKIYVIAPKYKNNKEFYYKNVIVKRVSSLPSPIYHDLKTTLPFSLETLFYIKKQKIDIIHFNSPITLGIEAIIISKILNIPLVGTFHTFFGEPQYLKHLGLNFRIFENLSWKYTKWFYNFCDFITCPSDITRKELLNHNIKKRILTISNGIEEDLFNNSNADKIKRKYNPSGPILLFVGRVSYEKSLIYLVQCIKLVLSKIPSVRLLIVGDGPQMKELKDFIISEELSDNVLLLGSMEREKLAKSSLYGASDLFVTASTTETQGISTLEAQINGLVCIGINNGGISELIKNNYNGALIKSGDKKAFANAIVRILSNNELYKKMQINTLKEIKKHKLPNIINIWERELNKLISNYKK